MRFLNSFRRQNLWLIKLTSFISSMFPFSLFLLIKYYNNHNKVVWIINVNNIVFMVSLITILSIIYMIYFYKIKVANYSNSNLNMVNFTFKNLIQEKTNTTGYLLSNVLPVVTLDMESYEGVIFIVVLLVLLAVMYIKNNLFYINPIYDILNIRIYNAECYAEGSNTPKCKFIISLIPIYEFGNTNSNVVTRYKSVEFEDLLIVFKEN